MFLLLGDAGKKHPPLMFMSDYAGEVRERNRTVITELEVVHMKAAEVILGYLQRISNAAAIVPSSNMRELFSFI